MLILDVSSHRVCRANDSYSAWGLGGDLRNRKLYRAKVDSQFNPSSFDVVKILDGIFPCGLRPSFEHCMDGATSAGPATHSPTKTEANNCSGSMGTDIPPHMSTKRHSFLITNEAAQKTYVSCLVWRERFEPTLEFILNDDEVCTMFEAHLDTEGANDDQLRHDFEVVKLIHRLVCSTGMHDSCSSVSRTSAAAGEDSGDELPHLESALLLQVEQYAKQHELKFSKEHPENLLQQVVQKSRLRAYIASFHM